MTTARTDLPDDQVITLKARAAAGTPAAGDSARPMPSPSNAGAADPVTAKKFPSGLNATSKAIRKGLTNQPTPSTYSLRIEYAPHSSGDRPISDRDLVPNWSREFTVSGKTTLEQLSEIILKVLDWDSLHLYEFRIHNKVYAHMVFVSEDDLFVDVQTPC